MHKLRKKAVLGNKRTLLKNKRVILGIKGHFGEVTRHIDFGRKAFATLHQPLTHCSGHFRMCEAKIKFRKLFLARLFLIGRIS